MMKKFLGLCLAALVIYTMYYDLHFGTLPQSPKAHASQSSVKQEKTMPSKEVDVQPGATVLSIVEHLNRKPSVPIKQIVSDFEKLNPGVQANNITIGKTYNFPIYRSSSE